MRPRTLPQMKKLMKSTKFPEHFDTKVDMKKVNIDVMIPWITTQVSAYLGFEDEVVIGYIEVRHGLGDTGRADAAGGACASIPTQCAARAVCGLWPVGPCAVREEECGRLAGHAPQPAARPGPDAPAVRCATPTAAARDETRRHTRRLTHARRSSLPPALAGS